MRFPQRIATRMYGSLTGVDGLGGADATGRGLDSETNPAIGARWRLGASRIEVHDIERDGDLLVFTSDRPRIGVFFDPPLRRGWYALDLTLRSAVPLKPRAVVGVIGEASEGLAFNLKPGRGDHYSAFFRVPARFDRLRLEPAHFRFEAAIPDVRLRRIGPAELIRAAYRAAISSTRKRGLGGLLRFLGSAFGTVVRPRRFDSFDTLGPQQRPAIDPAARYRQWLAIDDLRVARRLHDARVGRQPVPDRTVAVLATDAGSDALVRSLGEQPVARWTFHGAAPHGVMTDARVRPNEGSPNLPVLLRLGRSTGVDLIVLAPSDVRLSRQALAALMEAAERHPEAAVLFGDDDDLDADGNRSGGRFRSGWSEAAFEALDTLGPVLAFQRDALTDALLERPDTGFLTGLLLDLAETPGAIRHVPEILAHRTRPDAPPREAAADRLAALRARATARGSSVDYEIDGDGPAIRARQPVPDPEPLVSIIIPTRDRLDLLSVAVGSLLARTRYRTYEILVVDNGSTDPDTLAWMATPPDPRVRVLRYPHPFNYSAINNFAAAEARGSILLLLNNDTEVTGPDWLHEMVGWAVRDDVGAVGAKLLFPDGTVQHGGVVVLSRHGIAGHLHLGDPGRSPGVLDRLRVPQDLSAVTGACLAIRKSVYEAVGGLDAAHLAVAFNDVDLCLRVRTAGLRIIWTPYAELIHHESVSRGRDESPEKKARFQREVDHMAATWGELLERDPFYSPHFERGNANFVLRIE